MDELEQGDVALTNLLEILDKVGMWYSEMNEILNLKQEVTIDVGVRKNFKKLVDKSIPTSYYNYRFTKI